MRRLALATLLIATPAVSGAQSTQERLNQAIQLYEAFNVEAARPILQTIISPGYLQRVTPEERATAYKYLGASYAVLASPDTATQFFMGALDFDPFTDLDPAKFAASELEAFNKAKASLFKVAVRQMLGPALLRPQPGLGDTAAYTFRFISTQRSNMRIGLTATPTNPGDTIPEQVLYNGTNEGVRALQWRGVLSDGTMAPPGTYTLMVTATPTQGASRQPETQSLVFRLEHVLEPLEDTLPTLNVNDPTQLLPVRYPAIAPWQDLIKGSVVGLVAGLALPAVLGFEKTTMNHAIGASGFVMIGASASFLYRRRNPEIQLNVVENRRRQDVRTAFNARVKAANVERIARTVMVITPVAAAQ